MRKLLSRLKNDFVLLTFGTILGSFIKFFYSVFSKKMVGPSDYGMFSAICIIATYLNYLQLGTMNAYNRDYPQLKGAGKQLEARKIKNATLTYILIIYGCVAIVACSITCFLSVSRGYGINKTVGYVAVIIGSFFTALNSYATFSTKMEGKFNFAAITYVVQVLVSVLIGLFLISHYGYLGLYAEGLLSAVIGCVLFYKYWLRGFHFCLEPKVIWTLLISGIPLLVNNLIWTMVGSIDKFVILGFMDTTSLGYYSIATMGFSTMVLIPQTMSNVFYIKVNQEYGKTNDRVQLIQKSQRYTLLSALCTSIICLIAFYALPIFVNLVMPNYKNGILAAQTIVVGVAIFASTLLYGNIFTILKEYKALLANSIALCIFNMILSVTLVLLFGKNIDNVALGTSFSYALYSVLLVARLKRISKLSLWSFFYYSWLPVLSAVVPCIALQFIPISDIAKMVISLLVCMAVLSICYRQEIRKLFQK